MWWKLICWDAVIDTFDTAYGRRFASIQGIKLPTCKIKFNEWKIDGTQLFCLLSCRFRASSVARKAYDRMRPTQQAASVACWHLPLVSLEGPLSHRGCNEIEIRSTGELWVEFINSYQLSWPFWPPAQIWELMTSTFSRLYMFWQSFLDTPSTFTFNLRAEANPSSVLPHPETVNVCLS